MKSTLDRLLTNSFKPDKLVLYKSDGPLRKLKILSEHWETKVKEANEKCAPSEAEDSSFDNPVRYVPPRQNNGRFDVTREVTPRHNIERSVQVPVSLHHSNLYNNTSQVLPAKVQVQVTGKRPNLKRYARASGHGATSAR